ncbi:MAG: tetratricopeptide repeat protein, partial [Muribaculaceae bacterium]|nr:tetratricopeptide repeat protein [Muribaculaceae bacterium]
MSAAHLGKTDAHALLSYFLWRHPGSRYATQARLALGNLMLDACEYGEAYTEYSKIDPATLDSATADELAYNKGYCMLKRGEYDRARSLYGPLTRNKKYGDGARFYLGYISYAKKDYAEAIKYLSGLNSSKAPADMADYYLAQIYYIQSDYAKAASKANAVLNRNVAPQFRSEALRIAGESSYQLDDYAKAIKLLRQYAESTDEPQPSAMYILGVADYREGDYDDAIARLTPVAALDDAMGQSANLYIGQAFMQQGNYSSAIIAFDQALNMDFDPQVQETAFYNYAVAGTQGGKIPFGSSVTTFEEFIRRYPNSKFAPQISEYIVSGYMT